MSNQQRACELLRQAAQMLEQESVSVNRTTASLCTDVSTPTTSTTAHSAALRLATRNLFTPYGSARGRTRMPPQPRVTFWSHRFCALARSDQDQAPTREEKQLLLSSGLGEQKITFIKSSDPADFKAKIEERFPRLKGIGGYELLRCGISARVKLETLHIPPGGYTTQYLSDTGVLGQAVCFLRPIQKDLSVEDFPIEVPSDDIKESCFHCGEAILLRNLRSHVTECCERSTSASSSRRHSVQVPVCQFACATPQSTPEVKSDLNTEIGMTEKCPICQKDFQKDLIEQHADMCAISTEKNSEPESSSFDDYLSSMALNGEKLWDISVIRRMLVQQAMEEIEQAPEEEWKRKFCITFIGEEGLDAGGLTREFLTLLYDHSPVFENKVLSFDAQLLEKKHYFLMGKMVTMGILSGHPGPRNLMKHVVDYIVIGRTTGITDIPVDQLGRLDAVSAIQEISDSVDCNQMIEKYGDLLEVCGFRKVLSVENRQDAVSAMKSYYMFNRFIPSLLQFVEGLKLHGMLDMLRKCPEKAYSYLMQTEHVDSLTIKGFFKPVFSSDKAEKEDEEVILCNFHQFLKKLERGKISCISIDGETGSSSEVNLNTGHLLQALIGCPALPSCITEGIITFDHKSDYLTTVNTCAPSINFSKLSVIKNYSSFEELMTNVIVGSYGFGRE